MSDSHPEVQPTPTMRELACRQQIADLMQRAKLTAEALKRARLSPRPVELGPLMIENLAVLLNCVAFLMDETLTAQGLAPAISYARRESVKGNGRDGPSLVVPG